MKFLKFKLFADKVSYIETAIENGTYKIRYKFSSNTLNEKAFDNIDKANKFLKGLYKRSDNNTKLKNNNISNASEIVHNDGQMTQMYYFRVNNIAQGCAYGTFCKDLAKSTWEGLYGFDQNKYLFKLSEAYGITLTKLFIAYNNTKVLDEEEFYQKLQEYESIYDIGVNALEKVWWGTYECSSNGSLAQRQDFEKYKNITALFINMAASENLFSK